MKKSLLIMTFGLAMAVSAKAQIFIQDNEAGSRADSDPDLGINMPPDFGEGSEGNGYSPIGGGAVLLAALGGAYLLGKRNKER